MRTFTFEINARLEIESIDNSVTLHGPIGVSSLSAQNVRLLEVCDSTYPCLKPVARGEIKLK